MVWIRTSCVGLILARHSRNSLFRPATVRDAQGAVVAGASVKITNPATRQERIATSDENGDFTFPELSPGTYTLTVSKDGFKTAILSDIATSNEQVNTV